VIHTATSLNVVDTSNGKLLVGMRFSGVPAALEYLAHANLSCSVCGKHFSSHSTHTLMSRGNSWELMFPHNCYPPAIREKDPAAA
jgi:hypothetical protein